MSEVNSFSNTHHAYTPLLPETVNAARRTVAHHVRDPEKLAELLEMLNLLREEEL